MRYAHRDFRQLIDQMAVTRLRIGDQREIVRRLREGGHIRTVRRAETLLKVLEDTLADLEERRNAVLSALRQPPAASGSRPEEKPPAKRRRRSSG